MIFVIYEDRRIPIKEQGYRTAPLFVIVKGKL